MLFLVLFYPVFVVFGFLSSRSPMYLSSYDGYKEIVGSVLHFSCMHANLRTTNKIVSELVFSGGDNMGLILRCVLHSVDTSLEGSSTVFIWVPKRVLSSPYQLPRGTLLSGEIIEVDDVSRVFSGEEERLFSQLKGKPIDFFLLKRKVGDDAWFLSSSSWSTLRDYGVLPEDFELEVVIRRARFDDTTAEIYPKRDVRIG